MTILNQEAGYINTIVPCPWDEGFRIETQDCVLGTVDISSQWFETVKEAQQFLDDWASVQP